MSTNSIKSGSDGWGYSNKGVEWRVPTGDSRYFVFSATDLDRTPSGVKGKVEFGINDVKLAWSRLNMDSSQDRVRLVGHAVSTRSQPDKILVNNEEIGKNGIQHLMNQFCLHAFSKWVAQNTAQYVIGDPTIDLDFIANPYCISEAGTYLFAPPDSGKTYCGLSLAVSIDAGINTIWNITKPRRVLFVNLERGETSMMRRLGFINSALSLDYNRPLLMLNSRGRTINQLIEVIEASIEKNQVDYVLIDSISRSGQGGMGEDAGMNKLMDTLNALGGWFALAHTPRQDTSHAFGSVMQDAAVDVMIKAEVNRRDNRMGVKWTVTKGNDIARPQPIVVGFEFNQSGVCNIWKSSIREFPDLVSEASGSISDEIYSFISSTLTGNADATEIATNINKSRNYISSVLNSDHRFRHIPDTHPKQFGLAELNRQVNQ